MQRFVSFFIIGFYAFGLGFSDPSKSFAPTMKIKLSHTHEVVSGHHHHHEFAHNHQEEKSTDSHHNHDTDHKNSAPHSHELFISMANGCTLNFNSFEVISLGFENLEAGTSIYDELPPKDRALGSIFRPPIA